MARQSPAIRHTHRAHSPFQTVWWKPFVNMQKEITRTMSNGLSGTPFDNVISLQQRLLERMEDNISNAFGEVFNNRQMLTPWLLGDHTEPYIDIIENHRSYKLKAELPGVKENDIRVEFIDGGIQIEGEKYEECAEKGENYRHQECHAGYFSRTIALPEDADWEKAKTRFNLNVLTIEIPKKAGEEFPSEGDSSNKAGRSGHMKKAA